MDPTRFDWMLLFAFIWHSCVVYRLRRRIDKLEAKTND